MEAQESNHDEEIFKTQSSSKIEYVTQGTHHVSHLSPGGIHMNENCDQVSKLDSCGVLKNMEVLISWNHVSHHQEHEGVS